MGACGRYLVRIVVAMIVTATALVETTPATAAPATATRPSAAPAQTWTIMPVAQPTGPNGMFGAISCSSDTACMSVGSFTGTTAHSELFAAQLVDGDWTSLPFDQFAPEDARLAAVSCPTSSFCAAVGVGGTHTLAEHWDGTAWHSVPTPDAAGRPSSVLTSVSCASDDSCVAVGYATKSATVRVTYALRWDGTDWAAVPTLDPGTTNYFTGVSCPARRSCTAVGVTGSGEPGGVPLIETYDGGSWTRDSTPAPTGRDGLDAVSCTAPGTCTAVGRAPKNRPPRVLRGEDGVWTAQSAAPSGSRFSAFTVVSCSGPSTCAASGYRSRFPDLSHGIASAQNQPIFQTWDGAQWRSQAPPAPARGFTPMLGGLVCRAADDCLGAGRVVSTRSKGSVTTPTTLVTGFDGTTWTPQPTPNGTGTNGTALTGVSCARASSCLAVGSVRYSDREILPRASAWNGTRWIEQRQRLPRGRVRPATADVSCSGVADCLASGTALAADGSYVPYVASWTGGAVSYSTATVPSDATRGVVLNDVSCPTPRCFLSGYDPSPYRGLIESGSTQDGWTVESVPFDQFTGPASISCGSQASCVVAAYTDLLRYDGQSWTRQGGPANQYAQFSQVSCVDQFCMAVGGVGVAPGILVPYAEYAETATDPWVEAPVPYTPPDRADTTLTDISCATPALCVAVGFHGYANDVDYPVDGVEPVAFRWDGSQWSQLDPRVPDRGTTKFTGVSCPGEHVCYVVGTTLVDNHDDLRGGIRRAVIEQLRL